MRWRLPLAVAHRVRLFFLIPSNVNPSLIHMRTSVQDVAAGDRSRPWLTRSQEHRSEPIQAFTCWPSLHSMTARLRADSSRRVEGVGPEKPWQPHSTVPRSSERCQLLPRYIAARKDEWKGLTICHPLPHIPAVEDFVFAPLLQPLSQAAAPAFPLDGRRHQGAALPRFLSPSSLFPS